MLEQLEGKVIAFLIALGVLIAIGFAIFAWGHHVGSTGQAARDDKKVTACTKQNDALALAHKNDAATILGLKQANASFATQAAANEADLKKANADLTTKLAQQQVTFVKREKALKDAAHAKDSAQFDSVRVPDSILDILRH